MLTLYEIYIVVIVMWFTIISVSFMVGFMLRKMNRILNTVVDCWIELNLKIQVLENEFLGDYHDS